MRILSHVVTTALLIAATSFALRSRRFDSSRAALVPGNAGGRQHRSRLSDDHQQIA